MRWALLACAVAVVGFVAGRLAPVGPEPVRERVTETPPPCPDAEPAVREVEDRSRELGVLEAELLRGALAEADAIGLPVEWPADLPARFHEEAVERAVLATLDEGAALLTLDCSEYPCVAVTAYDSRDGSVQERAAAALEELRDDGYVALTSSHLRGDLGDGRQVLVVTRALMAPGTDDLLSNARRQFRFDELQAAAQPAVEEFITAGASSERR